MLNFNFNLSSDDEYEIHSCKSYRDGDWIIFYCPICIDYERRINWRTREMKSRNVKDNVKHLGNYIPHEYKKVFENLN